MRNCVANHRHAPQYKVTPQQGTAYGDEGGGGDDVDVVHCVLIYIYSYSNIFIPYLAIGFWLDAVSE